MDFSTLGNEAAAAKTANLTINWVAGGKCAIRRTAVQKIWQLSGHRLRNDPGMAFTSVEREALLPFTLYQMASERASCMVGNTDEEL